MSESTWGHGYFEDVRYTCGFYREMTPNWLDFCSVLRGVKPPREAGASFRYLELGSGMGLNLCMLAAAYPEAFFFGVDFNADHIAHSNWLAEKLDLTNVVFLEADLVKLADSPATQEHILLRAHSFEYVAVHGVLTWVIKPVQDALICCIEKFTKAGGLIYCSYNTNPGWQAGSIFRQLAEQERRIEPKSTAHKAYERARGKLEALLSYEEDNPSNLSQQIPSIIPLLSELTQYNPIYLLHEFAIKAWQPLYVDTAHGMLAAKQIYFIASGNPHELFPELIPSKIRSMLENESDISNRELLYDIATCRRFRRDIFSRGRCTLTTTERTRRLENFMFTDTRMLDQEIKPLRTDFGEVTAVGNIVVPLFQQLNMHSCSLRNLSEAIGQTLEHTTGLLSMLLTQNAVGIASPTNEGTITFAEAVIRKLAELISEGNSYNQIPAPGIGSTISINPEQASALHAFLSSGKTQAGEAIKPMLPLLARTGCIF